MRNLFQAARPILAAALMASAAGGVAVPAQAQIPGMLPSIEDVRPGAPLPIDGTWRIRENNELIIIAQGHAFAVDGWTHAFIFQIQPRQVVIRDLVETVDGRFVGDDLPLLSKVTMTPQPDGSLRCRTAGVVPVTYTLEPVELADDDPWGGDPEPDPFEPLPDPEPDPDDDWVSPWNFQP